MSETPRDQRGLWSEVSRSFEELGDALRIHLSPDAARSPSDPTTPPASRPVPDPAAPGRPADAWGEATAADASGHPVTDPHAPPSAADPAGPPSAGSPPAARPGPSTATVPGGGTAGTAAGDAGTATDPGISADAGAGAGAGADAAAGTGDADGAGGRGFGRFAGSADWDSARESVRDLGRNAQRIASQAGDAARDPQVRDSAQRAARSIGDAIVTTMEEFTADLRNRMRNPRWSDTDEPRPTEPPPIAPVEDDPTPH